MKSSQEKLSNVFSKHSFYVDRIALILVLRILLNEKLKSLVFGDPVLVLTISPIFFRDS